MNNVHEISVFSVFFVDVPIFPNYRLWLPSNDLLKNTFCV